MTLTVRATVELSAVQLRCLLLDAGVLGFGGCWWRLAGVDADGTVLLTRTLDLP